MKRSLGIWEGGGEWTWKGEEGAEEQESDVFVF